jgi:hypothetical protein
VANWRGPPKDRKRIIIAVRYGGTVPTWVSILKLAKEWGIPAWEIQPEPKLVWYLRWMTYQNIINKMNGGENDE